MKRVEDIYYILMGILIAFLILTKSLIPVLKILVSYGIIVLNFILFALGKVAVFLRI